MTDPLQPLVGRVALVTGASRRIAIGAPIARRLAADGAAVMLHSWTQHDAEQPWGADVGGPEALLEGLRAAARVVGHDDVERAQCLLRGAHQVSRFWVGQVGGSMLDSSPCRSELLEQLSAAEVDLSYAVNVRATLLLIQAFVAGYERRSGGRIVMFTSGQYHGAMPDELPYIATKAALHELTRSLAMHLMARGITVNCVNPGPNDPATPTPTPWPLSRNAPPAGGGPPRLMQPNS